MRVAMSNSAAIEESKRLRCPYINVPGTMR